MKVEVEDLTVSYVTRRGLFRRDIHTALTDVSFTINSGERIAVVGENGSGKTTLLRGLCNLADATVSGTVLFDGTPSLMRKPSSLPVHLAESDDLFPHFDVEKNIIYFLQLQGISALECARRLDEALSRLGIADLCTRAPGSLSKGQRQRVVLARMFVGIPEKPVLLFDEPLSHIDPDGRSGLLKLFVEVFDQCDATVVYVTHHRREAVDICGANGRILYLNKGVVQQFASLKEMAKHPATQEVKEFIGSWIESEYVVFRELHGYAVEGGVS